MKTSLLRATGSLLLGGFLHFSLAQEFVQDLGSSTVQAEISSQSILEGLRSEEDMNGEKLRRNMSTTMAETIKNEPDVALRSMGPAAARPVLKGLSGNHVEVTEDGSISGDLSATSPDHAVASEVLTVRSLRVVRGPNILRNSFSVAGGVIQMDHQDIPFGDTLFNGFVTNYAESAAPGYATAVGVNIPVMNGAIRGNLARRNMEDMRTSKGVLKNTEIDNISGSIGAAYSLGNFRIGGSYSSYNSDYGIPGGFIGGHPNGVDISLTKRNMTLQGMYLPQAKPQDTLNVVLRINRYHHKEFEGKDILGAEFAVNEENLLVEKALGNWGEFFGLRFGAELDMKSIEMGGYVFTPPTHSYGGSLFALGSLNGWSGMEITLAARTGLVYMIPKESVVADKSVIENRIFGLLSLDAEFSQRVGVGKFLTLDVYRTSRAPSIEELYNQGPHLAAYTYERGNRKLDAESGYGAELEYRMYEDEFTLRAAGHGTWFVNYLVPRATGDTNWSQILPIYQVQGGNGLMLGMNASIERNVEQGLYGLLSLSYVKGWYEDKTWGHMSQIPPFKTHAEIAYIWKNIRPGIYGDFVAPQNFVDKYEKKTPGYATMGLLLEMNWAWNFSRYSLVFKCDNLFDADVRNHLSRLKDVMPEKGRNFSGLLRVEF